MVYKERKGSFMEGWGRTIRECYPAQITEDECNSKGWTYHPGCHDGYSDQAMITCLSRFPNPGCYSNETIDHIKFNIQSDNLSFVTSAFSAVDIPIGAIKNGLGSLGNFFKGLFNSPDPQIPNPNLLEYKPYIVDMRATSKGPEPVWDLKPINDVDIAVNSHFSNTGKVIKTENGVIHTPPDNLPPKIDRFPQRLVDVDSKMTKFDIPKDLSFSKVDNNAFVSAKLKDMSNPIPTKTATVPNLNTKVNLDYDLGTMFKNSDSPTPNLPMVIKQTSKANSQTKYKGVITTPDNSVINVDIIETYTSTGDRVQDVELSYDYESSNGKKKFRTGYVNTINSSGSVTNSIPKDSTITDPNTGNTILNDDLSTQAPSSSPDLSSLNDALKQQSSKLDNIDQSLSKTNTQLEKMNDTLTDIKSQQKEEWNYKPSTATSFEQSVNDFKQSLTDYHFSLSHFTDFVSNVGDSVDNLMDEFNNAKNIFEDGIDSPDIPRGTCPFTISGPTPGSGKINEFIIDPCRFVSPYTSILTIFFTLWLSFEVIIFSLKYLFNVGGR